MGHMLNQGLETHINHKLRGMLFSLFSDSDPRQNEQLYIVIFYKVIQAEYPENIFSSSMLLLRFLIHGFQL